MDKIIKALVLVVLVIVYRPWFYLSKTLASGDWPYLFNETIQSFSFSPDPSFLWLGPYYQITSKISAEYFHFPWSITEKIWWYWMFLAVSFFSSWYLSKIVLKNAKCNFLTILIFLTNTYILMIVGGGQMGVALSYAFAPAVMGSFIELINAAHFKINFTFFKFAFLLAIQFMFDPRITFINMIAIIIYFLVSFFSEKSFKSKTIPVFFYAIGTAIMVLVVNSLWIIARFGSEGKNFFADSSTGSIESLRFLSFGNFSSSLSLLHPNWPENIFGKVYFVQPEFILISVLAFSSLLLLRITSYKSKDEKVENRNILFFALLGLIGAFLAKGAKEPVGHLYELLFSYAPGFSLFRDPTKFYLLVILSYGILIPFILERISEKLVAKLKWQYIPHVITILFILWWAWLIRPGLLGELSGTFKPRSVPIEYVQLKDFLIKDTKPFAIMWVPSRSPFSFFSTSHPIMDSTFLSSDTTPTGIRSLFTNKKNKSLLSERSIKYVIVPEDVEGKIFLSDRKYSEVVYNEIVKGLKSVSYLKPVATFGKIVVFQVDQ